MYSTTELPVFHSNLNKVLQVGAEHLEVLFRGDELAIIEEVKRRTTRLRLVWQVGCCDSVLEAQDLDAFFVTTLLGVAVHVPWPFELKL